jgi:hypothetical protein
MRQAANLKDLEQLLSDRAMRLAAFKGRNCAPLGELMSG